MKTLSHRWYLQGVIWLADRTQDNFTAVDMNIPGEIIARYLRMWLVLYTTVVLGHEEESDIDLLPSPFVMPDSIKKELKRQV